VHLVEVARYTCAHLDDVDRNETADIFVLVDDGPQRWLGDGHLRRGAALLLALAAASKDAR
jgi:hypothetical protein